MSRFRRLPLKIFAVLALGVVQAAEQPAAPPAIPPSNQPLMITPTVFDFGWCPDNAKVSAEFTVKNTGVDMIPITGVQPTCGCTASHFTPGSLATNDETKVVLTFNTRGYANSGFTKSAKVKTDIGGTEYTVQMTGFVTDDQAKVVPDQDGIASFEPNSKGNKKTLHIQNKNDKDITLEIVQKPASWATATLRATTVKAGASVPMDITVDGPFVPAKDTSVTLAASDGAATKRLTIAIRTGEPPLPIRKPSPPAAKPAEKTGGQPANPPAGNPAGKSGAPAVVPTINK